jgi:hypothetical protein
VQTPVEGKHVVFEHKPSDTQLFFRPHRLNERADPMTLAIVRRALDQRGLLERDEFESALRAASANGKAKAKRE